MLKQEEIAGGNSVEDSAKIFTDVLNNKGTKAQTNVVLANAACAISTIEENKTLPECVEIAKESLVSGKALNTFKLLMNN